MSSDGTSGERPSRRERANQRVLEYRSLSPLEREAVSRSKRMPRWLVVTLAGVVGSVVLAGGVLMWRFLSAYAVHDRIEFIDDPVVVERVSTACDQMTKEVQRLGQDPPATQEQRVALVRAQDAAVTAMVAQIRTLGQERLANDHPTNAWLADWESLVQARDVYSRLPELGTKNFQEPLSTNGEPVTQRINSLGDCPVPAALKAKP